MTIWPSVASCGKMGARMELTPQPRLENPDLSWFAVRQQTGQKARQALRRRCGADDNGVVFSLNWKIAPAFADRGRDQAAKKEAESFYSDPELPVRTSRDSGTGGGTWTDAGLALLNSN